MDRIEVIQGDITVLQVDAIVMRQIRHCWAGVVWMVLFTGLLVRNCWKSALIARLFYRRGEKETRIFAFIRN